MTDRRQHAEDAGAIEESFHYSLVPLKQRDRAGPTEESHWVWVRKQKLGGAKSIRQMIYWGFQERQDRGKNSLGLANLNNFKL